MRKARLKRLDAARRDFLCFIQAVWQKPKAGPFVIGRHTAAIAAAIDKAIDDFLSGKSTRLDIELPYRHGKSDLVSRYLPPYFLGRCQIAQPDVIMTGYGESLVRGFSKDAKAILSDRRYQEIFPGVKIAKGSDTQTEWKLEGSSGLVTATGLGGSLTGKGAHLLIVDDFCRNKAQARSETYRRNQWEAFTDAMSRLAPVSIAILCATSWHVDDVRGRLHARAAKDSTFPAFTRMRFPARNKDGSFLFEERFSKARYAEMYATEGATWAAALLDCNPVHDGGNRFKIAGARETPLEQFPAIRYVRAWDLASTTKEREKDDPDFTCGILAGTNKDALGRVHLWVKDCVAGQWAATERNRRIIETTNLDGPSVSVYMESFGGYKDAFEQVKRLLTGLRMVHESRLPGDKSAKLADLEPIFDAGNVHLAAGAAWLPFWIRQFTEFSGDGATHDDACDSTAICYHATQKQGSTIVEIR